MSSAPSRGDAHSGDLSDSPSSKALLWSEVIGRFLNKRMGAIERDYGEEIARIPLDAMICFLKTGEVPSRCHSIWKVPYYIWDLYCACLTYPCDLPAAVSEQEVRVIADRLIEIERQSIP